MSSSNNMPTLQGFLRLAEEIAKTGRPVGTVVIQQSGGTRTSINEGTKWVEQPLKQVAEIPRVPVSSKIVAAPCCTSMSKARPTAGLADIPLVASEPPHTVPTTN